MTDELVKFLRSIGEHHYDVAADRIEKLDEENDILMNEVEFLEQTRDDLQKAYDNAIAERDGLLRCVTDNHVALCRAEKAEAERDRLKLDVAQFRRVNDGLQDMLNQSKEVGFAFDNLAEVTAEPDRVLMAAVQDIARQKKTDEMDTEYDVEYADFEGGYDAIIDVARVALRALPAVQPDRIEQLEKELSTCRMAQVVMDNTVAKLTAERDKYESAWMTAEGQLADAEAEVARLKAQVRFLERKIVSNG